MSLEKPQEFESISFGKHRDAAIAMIIYDFLGFPERNGKKTRFLCALNIIKTLLVHKKSLCIFGRIVYVYFKGGQSFSSQSLKKGPVVQIHCPGYSIRYTVTCI